MSTALLATKGLTKYFKVPSGWLHAVDGVDIEIHTGHTLGVVGESGCGKSTLGRLVLKLLEPTSGQILIDGTDITHLARNQMDHYRSDMQIIFQDPYSSLNPRMTVVDLISEPMWVRRMYKTRTETENKAREYMELVGLAKRLEDAYPHELDGGRRQRIGVARALCLNPRFVVCDEPVSALDVSIQAQILNLLMDLQDDMNLTYMFITHDLSVVKHISNNIAVMYLGICVEYAEKDELFDNPRHPYTQALLKAIPVPDLSSRLQEENIIKGEVTSPINPKPGCRFASRCQYVMQECSGADIPVRSVNPGHTVKCLRI